MSEREVFGFGHPILLSLSHEAGAAANVVALRPWRRVWCQPHSLPQSRSARISTLRRQRAAYPARTGWTNPQSTSSEPGLMADELEDER